jgi:hypothetical protein
MDKKNIFELWRENGGKLPFRVVLDSWDGTKHYAVIASVVIKKWPYGNAFGQYFFNGVPGESGLIRNASTYRWKLKI